MSDWVQAISRMSEGRATRSTTLQPMLWLVALLGVLICSLVWNGAAPQWLLVFVSVLFAMCIGVLVITYVCFAFKNPELLRSEKFLIRKMEIEQSSIGDSIKGVVGTGERVLQSLPQPTGEEKEQ
jgi:hypothetical protein